MQAQVTITALSTALAVNIAPGPGEGGERKRTLWELN